MSQTSQKKPRQSTSTGRRVRQSRQKMLGHGLSRIDPNPPPLHLSPWNRATIIIKKVGSQEIYVHDFANYFKNQLDPTGHALSPASKEGTGYRIQFKLQRIRLYAPDAKTIGLSIEDFADSFDANKGGRDQLAGVADVGTSAYPPALQYIYPVSHKNLVLRTDDIWWDVPLFNVTATSSTAWLSFITVLWTFDGPVKFTVNFPTIADFMSVATDAVSIIKDKQPSTISKVVDGVTTTASIVSVLAGEGPSQNLDQRLARIEKVVSSLSSSIEKISIHSSFDMDDFKT